MVYVAVHNSAKVQVTIPPLFLHVGILHVVAPPSTKEFTVHISTIVGSQTSYSKISHNGQDISTVHPSNYHTFHPEIIIAHNIDSSDNY